MDLRSRMVRITAKGRRELVLPIGTKAARDIDRYVRVRAGHPRAADAWLWLGTKGRLTASGVYQMIKDRGAAVGLPDLHPLLRHTFSHDWLANGGSEGDLMRLAGWKSRAMLPATRPARPTSGRGTAIGVYPPATGHKRGAAGGDHEVVIGLLAARRVEQLASTERIGKLAEVPVLSPDIRSGALGGELRGTVAEIGITYVRLDASDGPVHLPNSQVLAAAVAPLGTSTPDGARTDGSADTAADRSAGELSPPGSAKDSHANAFQLDGRRGGLSWSAAGNCQ